MANAQDSTIGAGTPQSMDVSTVIRRPASAEHRLRELGLTLPEPAEPLGTYVEAVQTGNLSINSGSSVHMEAPFGGVKRSGLGRELGLTALDAYTEWKTIYIDVR